MRKFKLTAPEPTESQLHATVAQFLDWALMPPAFYTTFPAGWGVLTKATAGRLKGSGLKRGMPDLQAFYKGKSVCIELKSHTGRLTPEQQNTHELLRAAGVQVFVCTTLDEVIEALREVGFPLRRTRGASDVA